MKAYFSSAYGGPEVSQYGDFPDPVTGEGQLLIEVKAVSINPVDYKVKKGVARFLTTVKFPRVFGSDFSGIVKQTGSGVTQFKSGDRVYGASPVIWGKPGALAQMLAIDEKYARAIPEGMSFEEAASLPIAALTALNGIRKTGVKKGSQVLINGVTGGVGHFAVQIASAKGAIVTGTCNPANSELAMKLGADDTISYSREVLSATEKRFDVILDAYGHMKSGDAIRLLKKDGIYATTMIRPFLFITSFFSTLLSGKRLTSSNLRSLPEDMAEMERLFALKKLVPVIENYYTLDNSAEAFEMAENGKPRGKVIVRI